MFRDFQAKVEEKLEGVQSEQKQINDKFEDWEDRMVEIRNDIRCQYSIQSENDYLRTRLTRLEDRVKELENKIELERKKTKTDP